MNRDRMIEEIETMYEILDQRGIHHLMYLPDDLMELHNIDLQVHRNFLLSLARSPSFLIKEL
jgi:hypothetical protein